MKQYKIIDLFGNEQIKLCENTNSKPNLFSNYDGFVDKFEVKKTTDDCYTPPEIYNIVLEYVSKNYNLEGKEIVRPFFPGGDYEAIEYNKNSVVIDNPPFSIISKICRFYIELGVPFFLFAPHLTLFGPNIDCTHIVVGCAVTYENKATVKTSFLSNMMGNAKIIGCPELYEKIKEFNDSNKVRLPKYEYPLNVITVSHVSWCVERGIPIVINKNEVVHIRDLDSQKVHKKALFGSGFLISEKAAAEKAAAEKAAAEKAAAEKAAAEKAAAEKAAAEKENIIIWELSDRELEIIENLENKIK